MRLEVAASYHQEALAGQAAAPATCAKYARIEAEFIAFLSAPARRAPTVADLTIANVRAYLAHLRAHPAARRWGDPVARGPSTLYLRGRMLKTWSRLLARERPTWLPDGDPLAGLRLKRVTAPPIEVFSREQYDRLLLAASEGDNPQRNRAVLLFAGDTGCRLSEICSLTLPHLELAGRNSQGTARIPKGKTANAARNVHFGRAASRAIELYVQGERQATEARRARRLGRRTVSDRVFLSERGTPLSDDSVQWMLKVCADRAGLHGMEVHPHVIRHSFAVWYLRDHPGQIEQLRLLLGHANLEMVKRYARLSEADVAASYSSVMDRKNGDDR